MTSLPVLYSFRRCPYAMRARMALHVAGVELEHREILLKERPDELRAISPKATVPVVQLADGQVLEESLDIVRWAMGTSDPLGWLPREQESVEVERLIAWNDGEFKASLDRYKYATRFPDADPLAARQRGEEFLTVLEGRLGGSGYLFRPEPMLADVCIFPFVRQFARADDAWFASSGYTSVGRWLEELEGASFFQAVMRKLPPWQPGAEPVRFRSVFPAQQ